MNSNISRHIEIWPVDRLVPYARNARTHSQEQIAQIAASLQEFGFTNPILVDSHAGIIAGHARWAAARTLHLREVPVIVLDHLSDTQKRAYILADNKLALNAGWDAQILRMELTALQQEDFHIELAGFSEIDLEELVRGLARDVGAAGPDAVPQATEASVTRAGDVWLLGSHRVLCGDALSPASFETNPFPGVPQPAGVLQRGRIYLHGLFGTAHTATRLHPGRRALVYLSDLG